MYNFVVLMDFLERALQFHRRLKGKLEIHSKVGIRSAEDLSLAYTPGVAEPCREIAKNKSAVYDFTMKGNAVLVVSDGSAVLGLGNIGAEAAIPVMEGKSLLFKEFAGIDAFPICISSQNPATVVEVIRNIAPVFGGINIEDIKAPQCFEVESALQNLGVPVMHDDQHGTAIVVLAALMNALKVVDKDISDAKMVINGAGAAGTGIVRILRNAGIPSGNIAVCDRRGIIYKGRSDLDANRYKSELAAATNSERIKGGLSEAVRGADAFIGVSAKNVLSKSMVRTMSPNPIIIAMANPDPEILPRHAQEAGAAVVATGRSDYPNQVNNVLAFPGIFRGALDARATRITDGMKIRAANALASLVEEPSADKILPSPLNKSIVPAIAKEVGRAWRSASE